MSTALSPFSDKLYDACSSSDASQKIHTQQVGVFLSMCLATANLLQSCPTVQPYGLHPARLLCPWDSPGKNTGVGCHALLHGIFPTRESNPGLSRLPELAARFLTTSANWEALPYASLFLLWRKIFPEVLKGPPQLPLVRFVLCGCTQTSTWQKVTMIKNYYNVHLLGPG